MPTRHLTDATVKRLPLPATGSIIIADDKVSGFGVRLTANGARSYVLRYRVRGTGRDRTYTVGDARHWRVTEARAEAKRLKQIVDQGEDPFGDLQAERKAPTVIELCERFALEHYPKVRENTADDYARIIKHHITPHFGQHTKVADVKYSDIDALHRKLTKAGHPYSANRAVAMMSKMFSLAIRWQMRTDNPCKGVERNIEARRVRYTSGDELARLTPALAAHADQQASDIVRLLMLTGCRKRRGIDGAMGGHRLGQGHVVEAGQCNEAKAVSSQPAQRAGAATTLPHP
jgi:hypothetical protein